MDIKTSETPEAVAETIAADFEAFVQETLLRQDKVAVALAGGATPKLFYSRLTQEPYRSAIPWGKLWIFWGDERCVPPDHSDSNFHMVKEALLDHVSILPSHVARMRGEDPPPESARAYEKILRDFYPGQSWPHFDLILLGLGPDGHTASLIPGTPALIEHGDRWVVGNVVRSLQTVRITLTLPAINQARQIWFLVTGAKKKEVFAKMQQGPDPQCPASLIKPETGTLRAYVDKAVVI